MRQKILFLTNTRNDAPLEDQVLIQRLGLDFDLIISHPLDCLNLLNHVSGIVIRNIWPTHEYQVGWDRIKQHLRESGLPVYNPLVFKGDIEGKDYLIELYERGYPVIPSIDNVDNLGLIPDSEYYWVKPKHSCDGIGAEKLSRAQLLQLKPQNSIIQPFMEFRYEPSFFFIDDQFSHALWAKHRLHSDSVANYKASREDVAFATKFVRWCDLGHGTQRIDAIRTFDGNLLLTEIENLCPYLYLSESGIANERRFLEAFCSSLRSFFAEADRLSASCSK